MYIVCLAVFNVPSQMLQWEWVAHFNIIYFAAMKYHMKIKLWVHVYLVFD